MVDEQINLSTSVIVPSISSDNELEEVVIPNENNSEDDDQLDDVIPCEFVETVEQDVPYEVVDNSNDGFYDDVGYTPTTSIDQMVDIHSEGVTSGNELEEVDIPNENNSEDDDQLDDIIVD